MTYSRTVKKVRFKTVEYDLLYHEWFVHMGPEYRSRTVYPQRGTDFHDWLRDNRIESGSRDWSIYRGLSCVDSRQDYNNRRGLYDFGFKDDGKDENRDA